MLTLYPMVRVLKWSSFVVFNSLFFLSCLAQKTELKEAFPNLKFDHPVEFIAAPDGSNKIFIVEQGGKIKVIENEPGVKEARVFLDIEQKVESGGEKGLLGLAFHPNFKENGYFYVNYTGGEKLTTYISRYSSKKNMEVADPQSERVLLSYEQPFGNHNGGKIAFGPDGFLYISAGDGGSGGDPYGNGQNLNVLLGKIIRIDVDRSDNNRFYSIPPDNPFKDKKGSREEIFAYGLRNVWKFSFDKKTGKLWASDVGQNDREEVDVIEKGGNYGWNIREGTVCFKNKDCEESGFKLPIHEYLHKDGLGQSITGGYVYRGKTIKELEGWYVYGDYTSGNIWKLKEEGKKTNTLIAKLPGAISSFGEDANGEIYVCSYGDGKIYKLVNKE